MPRARFGTTRQPWRESVVTGTNGRLRRHSRLSSRISRSTRLWLTTQPSRRSCGGDPPIAVVRGARSARRWIASRTPVSSWRGAEACQWR